MTAAEIADLKKKMQALARLAEEHLRLDALLDAAECPPLPACQPPVVGSLTERGVKIAVACDKAFCFYYQENLDLLREIGAILDDRSFEETAALADAVRREIAAEGRLVLRRDLLKDGATREEVDDPDMRDSGRASFIRRNLARATFHPLPED